MATLDGVKTTVDLAKELGTFISSVKDKAWGNKNAAYDKLSEVLDEIAAFFEAVQNEISNFQSLEFSDSSMRQTNKKALFDLEGGMLRARIEMTRGHCHKIELIYETHLDKWFKEVLSNSEFLRIRDIFFRLSTMDSSMLYATIQLEDFMRAEASIVLNLLNDQNFTDADSRIIASRAELSPLRQSISDLLASLMILRNKFMLLAKRI